MKLIADRELIRGTGQPLGIQQVVPNTSQIIKQVEQTVQDKTTYTAKAEALKWAIVMKG